MKHMAIKDEQECSECMKHMLNGERCLKGLCKIVSGQRMGERAQYIFSEPKDAFAWFSFTFCKKYHYFENYDGKLYLIKY